MPSREGRLVSVGGHVKIGTVKVLHRGSEGEVIVNGYRPEALVLRYLCGIGCGNPGKKVPDKLLIAPAQIMPAIASQLLLM
jgi:hypothetical protein